MRIRIGVSLFFALIAGIGVSSQWKQWVLFALRELPQGRPAVPQDISTSSSCRSSSSSQVALRRARDRAHRHRGGALPQRGSVPEPVPARHTAGERTSRSSRSWRWSRRRSTTSADSAQLSPGVVGCQRHRCEGAAPALNLPLHPIGAALPLEHPPPRLGAPDHRGRPLGSCHCLSPPSTRLPTSTSMSGRTNTRRSRSKSTATSAPPATPSVSTR